MARAKDESFLLRESERLFGLWIVHWNVSVSFHDLAAAWLWQKNDVEAQSCARGQAVNLEDLSWPLWSVHLFVKLFLLNKSQFSRRLVELEEVSTEIDLVSVERGLRVGERTDAPTSKVQSCLDLYVLWLHREDLSRALLKRLEFCLLDDEFHLVPPLVVVFVPALIRKWIDQVLFKVLGWLIRTDGLALLEQVHDI